MRCWIVSIASVSKPRVIERLSFLPLSSLLPWPLSSFPIPLIHLPVSGGWASFVGFQSFLSLMECLVLCSLHLEDLGSLTARAQRFTPKCRASALYTIIDGVRCVKSSYRGGQQRWVRCCESSVEVVNNGNNDITSIHSSRVWKVENNISVFLLQARAADCCMARDSSVVFCGFGENAKEVLFIFFCLL